MNNHHSGPLRDVYQCGGSVWGLLSLLSGYFLFFNHNRDGFFWLGAGLFILGSLIWLGGNKACEDTYRNYGANRIVHKVNTNCPSLPKRWIDRKLVHLVNQNYEIVT